MVSISIWYKNQVIGIQFLEKYMLMVMHFYSAFSMWIYSNGLVPCYVTCLCTFLQWGTSGHVMGLDVQCRCKKQQQHRRQSFGSVTEEKENRSNMNKEFCCLAFRDTQGLNIIICQRNYKSNKLLQETNREQFWC